MLGPHLPSLPPAPSEGRSTPCAFGIPDGSYRCLALEAEESGGEEGLQGEAGLTDLEEDRVASRSGDKACRATQGPPQLPEPWAPGHPVAPGRHEGFPSLTTEPIRPGTP